jgi:WD40 repeat protein
MLKPYYLLLVTICSWCAIASTDLVLADPAAARGTEHDLRPIMDLNGFTGPVTGLSLSSDGSILAASGQKVVRLWDLRTGRRLGVLRGEIGEGNNGDCVTVAFSPDNCELIVGVCEDNDRGSLRIYDIRDLSQVTRAFSDLPSPAQQLLFTGDGRHLVVACRTGQLRIYEWRTRTLIESQRVFSQTQLPAIYLLADASRLLCLTKTDTKLLTVPGLSLSADGERLHDRDLRRSAEYRHMISSSTDSLPVAAASLESGQWLAALVPHQVPGSEFSVRSWSAGNPAQDVTYSQHGSRITAVALSETGELAASAGADGEIHVWDAHTGTSHFRFCAMGAPVYAAFLDTANLSLGFTTTPVPVSEWRRNHYGEVDQTLNLRRGGIQDFVDSRRARLHTEQDGRVTLAYPNHTFELRYSVEGAAGYRIQLPPGISPTCFALLEPQHSTGTLPIVVGDSSGKLMELDFVSGQVLRIFEGHTGFVTSAKPTVDGRFLVTSSTDRTIRIWSLGDSPERFPAGSRVIPLLNVLVIDDDDWIAWSPRGYYDATPGCGRFVGWHVNQGDDLPAAFYSLHGFRRQLYRPDLVRLILERASIEDAIDVIEDQAESEQNWEISPLALNTDLAKPSTLEQYRAPEVRLLSPQDGTTTRTGKVHLLAEVKAPNELPITKVRILVNGRPTDNKGVSVVNDDSATGDETSFSRAVTLVPGENEICVLASNGAATSEPIIVRVAYDAPVKEINALPNLHLLSIGISDYRDASLSLRYAHEDALAFARAWQSQQDQVFGKIDTSILVNEEATAPKILTAMEQLGEQVSQRDLAVIFISAHGIRNRQLEYFLATHEIDPENLPGTGLHFSAVTKLLESLPCKVLLFVDTCHAAGITGAKAVFRDPLYELTSEEYGAIVFSSSLAREISLEDEKWGHGAFTKAILDTFGSSASDINQDGFLSLTEMEQSVSDRVTEMTDGQQHPVMKRPATIHNIPFYFVGEQESGNEDLVAGNRVGGA